MLRPTPRPTRTSRTRCSRSTCSSGRRSAQPQRQHSPPKTGKAPRKQTTTLRDGATFSVPSPLFNPERLIPGFRNNVPAEEKAALKAQAEQRRLAVQKEEEKRLLSVNLDPDPTARRSLERKLVIKGVTKHGRMTKAAKIARTERTSLYKSHFLPTSVKKMQKILRQIAGKTVSEALVQLRFSPKKVARDIMKGLIIAQDEAIAGRGMGLGDKHALKKWIEQRNEVASTLAELDETTPKPKGATQVIELKDGKKKLVKDPTEIYIDQAWCGRGEAWKSPEFRARGRVNMLTHRTTSKFSNTRRLGSLANSIRFFLPAQGRKDTDAHLGGDQEEAREPQALGRSARSTSHSAATVLLVVIVNLNVQHRRMCVNKKPSLSA
jgi:ribosomal protein L22